MYFLQNFFIFLRKLSIRILFREYPNKLLKSSSISSFKPAKNINLMSSTDNFWVSESMFRKWGYYSNFKKIGLNIYSNKQVNTFMKDNFKNDLIYEIYQRSILPVQKIDLFRINMRLHIIFRLDIEFIFEHVLILFHHIFQIVILVINVFVNIQLDIIHIALESIFD